MIMEEAYAKAIKNALEYPENYNDIFEGYENDFPKALALIEWQKREIEQLNVEVKIMRSAAQSCKLHYEYGQREAIIKVFGDITSELAKLLPFQAIRLINGRSIGKSFELGREKAINDVIKILAELEKKYVEKI